MIGSCTQLQQHNCYLVTDHGRRTQWTANTITAISRKVATALRMVAVFVDMSAHELSIADDAADPDAAPTAGAPLRPGSVCAFLPACRQSSVLRTVLSGARERPEEFTCSTMGETPSCQFIEIINKTSKLCWGMGAERLPLRVGETRGGREKVVCSRPRTFLRYAQMAFRVAGAMPISWRSWARHAKLIARPKELDNSEASALQKASPTLSLMQVASCRTETPCLRNASLAAFLASDVTLS